MNTVGLKFCPFCGGNDVKIMEVPHVTYVNCTGCGADGPLEEFRDDAIQKWNTRPNEAAHNTRTP